MTGRFGHGPKRRVHDDPLSEEGLRCLRPVLNYFERTNLRIKTNFSTTNTKLNKKKNGLPIPLNPRLLCVFRDFHFPIKVIKKYLSSV